MIIKKLLKSLLVTCLFFVIGLVSAGAVFAGGGPTIYFDPSSASPQQGANVQATVKIDVGSDSIFGADAVINYPADDLVVQSVTYGGFFTDTITPIQNSGQIIIRGSFFSSTTGFGTGSGNFAIINFVTTKGSGTGNVSFGCSGAGNDTDIIDSSGNNILPCSNVFSLALTYKSAATAPPGSGNGPTNACGGTCGSIYNCNVNLFCYQGYCRNPDCASSSNCVCPTKTPTPKPTVKPTVKPTAKATGKPTPQVVTIAKTTPFPFVNPVVEASAPPAAEGRSVDLKSVGIALGLGAIAVAIILMAINALRKGGKPPKFTPPTGINESSQTYNVPPPLKSTPEDSNPPFPA